MKAKLIVAAVAALCSAGAMAQLNPSTATSYLTYYIGGASTQGGAVSIIVPTLFASSTPIVTITQTSGNAVTAYYGMSNATYTGTSQPMLVIYNSTNGSFAGLGQLVYNGSQASNPWTESKVLTIGPSGDALTCNLTTAPYTCTTADSSKDAFQQIDMALSDVYPDEGNSWLATNGYTPGSNNNLALSNLVITTTGLEGFGVAVNPALYAALQAAQGLSGTGAAGQPSLQSSDVASLISESGAIKSASQLLQNNDQSMLTVVERTFDSGTQAATDIYFLNNVCGNAGYGGAQSPVSSADGGANGLNPGFFNVLQEEVTGNVKSDLNAGSANVPSGYAIGILSLTSKPTQTASGWNFVKLDGISPNYSAAGVLDAYQRNAFASGAYRFATEMSASYRKTTTAANLAMNKAVVAGLQNSALHNLVGLAYLDNPTGTYTAGGQQARYNHNSNNCTPLIDTNF